MSIRRNALPSDPLEALGPSLFLTILSCLTYSDLLAVPQISKSWHTLCQQHRTGLWRPVCTQCGVEDLSMPRTVRSARTAEPVGTTSLAEAGSNTAEGASGSEPAAVDWKDRCKQHVLLDRNWRFGRCRERWITGCPNEVWRFKLDEEEGTCIYTSQARAATSRPLFSAEFVRAYAHLEFSKGYAVFDVGSGSDDLTIQVWRTQGAIARSPLSQPESGLTAAEVRSLKSYTVSHWMAEPYWPAAAPAAGIAGADAAPLPRGHLAYYRKITPPTPCKAFRARADKEGTAEERPMLATAGERAVYIWDLKDKDREMEVVPIGPAEDGKEIGIQYVEFDDDHIFLCGVTQLHIFSRHTKKRLLAYPPASATINQICAAAYFIDLEDADRVEVMDRPRGPGQTIVGKAELEGYRRPRAGGHDVNFDMAMMLGCDWAEMPHAFEEQWTYPAWHIGNYNFSACHYTGTDLVCGTQLGQLLITRDYASILACTDQAERDRRWASQTIAIGLGEPIKLLAVDRTHITASTPAHIIYLDTAALPSLPLTPPQALPESAGRDAVPTRIRPIQSLAERFTARFGLPLSLFSGGEEHDDAVEGGLVGVDRHNTQADRVKPVDSDNICSIADRGADDKEFAQGSPTAPPIRIYSILSTTSDGISVSSCAQITRTGIYQIYDALGERDVMEMGGAGGGGPEIPNRAVVRGGICVRGWNFGLQEDDDDYYDEDA